VEVVFAPLALEAFIELISPDSMKKNTLLRDLCGLERSGREVKHEICSKPEFESGKFEF